MEADELQVWSDPRRDEAERERKLFSLLLYERSLLRSAGHGRRRGGEAKKKRMKRKGCCEPGMPLGALSTMVFI